MKIRLHCLCILLSLFLFTFAVTACNSSGNSSPQDPPDEVPDDTPDPTDPTTPDTDDGSFNIVLRYPDNSLSEDQKATFERAAQRWETIITGDLANITQALTEAEVDACDEASTAVTIEIDDLLIDVFARPIDGEFGTLAAAGPCYTRGDNGLPFFGTMVFDTADAGDAAFESTVLHEMGHVFGIGTLWDSKGFTNCDSGAPDDPEYTGEQAVAAYKALGQTGNVPVANTGGGGTACGHWRESVFDTEMMTGFADTTNDPISRMTIQALADLGFTVDVSQADPYSIPACSPNCDTSDVALQSARVWERLKYPIGTMTEQGLVPYNP